MKLIALILSLISTSSCASSGMGNLHALRAAKPGRQATESTHVLDWQRHAQSMRKPWE